MFTENLIELSQLLDLLGYTDLRSVRTWAKKNKVPVIIIGKKSYCARNFLDLHIQNQINSFVKTNFDNPAEVIIAVESSDSEKFSRMISSPVNMETKKESKSNKNLMSKASQQFLKTIE